jgi:hypothetical protein
MLSIASLDEEQCAVLADNRGQFLGHRFFFPCYVPLRDDQTMTWGDGKTVMDGLCRVVSQDISGILYIADQRLLGHSSLGSNLANHQIRE